MFITCHIECKKSGEPSQIDYSEELKEALKIEEETEFRTCRINVNNIICYYPAGDQEGRAKTFLCVIDNTEYCLQETFEEICQLIDDAIYYSRR